MSDFSADNRAIGDTTANDASSTPGPASTSPSPFGPLSASRNDDLHAEAQERQPEPAPAPAQDAPVANGAPNGVAQQRQLAEVKGRIEVADEVVEKVAALAAMEVAGVADLGGDFERAIESVRDRIGIGNKRGDQGVRAKITGREVSISVTIMIEYGHVVMDVARNVKNNVALQANRMLGLRVVEVNVKVDDVRLPHEVDEEDDADGLIPIEG